ncbi:MAG TPA: hypothetical protein VFW37_08720 [Alphaproteobacteria bacterium]|nr:hypothetical protein [Alphaproteobacteria bacterium]
MSKPMSISRMIELARAVKMTEEQWEEQRRSFAFGNTAFENPNITREMIDEIADRRLADKPRNG